MQTAPIPGEAKDSPTSTAQKQCPEGLIPPTCSKQQVEIQPLLQAIWKLRVMLKISKHHLLEENIPLKKIKKYVPGNWHP